jgi:hypothetical protein
MKRDETERRRDWLRLWPGWHTLIEPTIGSTPGAPDVHLVSSDPPFPPGWVEFKALDGSGLFQMRREQVFWARNYCAFDRRAALVVLGRDNWWAIPLLSIGQRPFLKNYDPGMFPHLRVAGLNPPSIPLTVALETAYDLKG